MGKRDRGGASPRVKGTAWAGGVDHMVSAQSVVAGRRGDGERRRVGVLFEADDAVVPAPFHIAPFVYPRDQVALDLDPVPSTPLTLPTHFHLSPLGTCGGGLVTATFLVPDFVAKKVPDASLAVAQAAQVLATLPKRPVFASAMVLVRMPLVPVCAPEGRLKRTVPAPAARVRVPRLRAKD